VIELLAAFQFLTRLPVPLHRLMTVEQMGRSIRWFPLVGGMLGAIVGVLDLALAGFATPELRAVVAVTLLAMLTGGLHLDGLMDSCDGLFSVAPPERRLEIMRDSRAGSFAVVGLGTILLLKYAAILALPEPIRLPGFVAVGAISRWTMVYAMVRYPPARSDGLGSAYKAYAGRTELAWGTAIALTLSSLLGASGLLVLIIGWLLAVVIAQYTVSKISGLTGDVYGAICECVEVGLAIGLPLIVAR
jgi:adenosylcobinamide-GDP ribazoletransferase